MKKYSLLLIPLVIIAFSMFGMGCVTRARLKAYGDERYAAGRKSRDIEVLEDDAYIEDGKRAILAHAKEASMVREERDALAEKIAKYLSINCLCKHKDVLKGN